MKYLLFLIPFLIHAQSDLLLLMDDGASFLPSDIPDLSVWIDPAVEYCEGVPPEYNDIIDRSGNGNDATLFNQASWYADSCNNLPAIYFDGSDDYILISDSLGYQFTVFYVVKAYQNTGNGRVIGNDTDTKGVYTGTTKYTVYFNNSLQIGNWAGWHIIVWQGLGNDAYSYYDGGDYTTGSMAGATQSARTRLGIDRTPQKCIFAEYIKYDRVLTEAEVLLVSDYLNKKFNIY